MESLVRWRGSMQPKESSCRQRRSLWIGCCYPHPQVPGSHVYVQLCSLLHMFRNVPEAWDWTEHLGRRSFEVAVHAYVPGARISRVCSTVSAAVLFLGGLEVKEAPAVVSSSRATAQCFPIADVAVDVLILFFHRAPSSMRALVGTASACGYIGIHIHRL